MSNHEWRTAYTSVIGSSHQKNGTQCQDAGNCRIVKSIDGNDVLLSVASDGAGSATRSEIGSKITVDTFLEQFGEMVKTESLIKIDKLYVLNWIRNVNAKILEKATEENLHPREFACTVLAAIVAFDEAVFFQVGDGAIVISEFASTDYCPMFWPQHGEFANQTNFIFQDNIEEVLEFKFIKQAFKTVSIFTDGIERLVLDFSSKTAHSPAFRSIFDWLVTCEVSRDDSPSAALTAYLGSDYINSRTDDDKTLVMAIRATT